MKEFERRLVLALTACVLAASACTRSRAQGSVEQRLVVYAASSLRDAFESQRQSFERERPGVEVALQFAGSQELRTQIEHGAPADVFAAADEAPLAALVRAGLAREPVTFARNELAVVVSRGESQAIRSFAELPRARRVVLGAPEVAVGRYAIEALDRASAGGLGADFRSRVEARVVSRELNARQVLAKVTMGEADAAIVYRTDAISAANRVVAVEIPRPFNVVADYPIAVIATSPRAALARAWVAHVQSSEGRRALRAAGFMDPGDAGP